MLTCYRARRALGAYLAGALDERGARFTAAHLGTCGRCQQEANGLRRLHTLLQRTPAVAAPADWTGFWPGIVRGIEAGRARAEPAAVSAAPAWWRHPRLAFGGALAAALLASIGLWQGFYVASVPEAGALGVQSARTEIPGATVMVYSPPERDLDVVWVFGLE